MHQCIKFISFWNDTLHVLDGLSIHHLEFKTVETATDICQILLSACLLASKQTAVSVWLVYVQSWAHDGRKDHPKHVVSFQNKNLLQSTLLTAVFCTRLLVLHMWQLFHNPLSYPSKISLRIQQLYWTEPFLKGMCSLSYIYLTILCYTKKKVFNFSS